MKPLLAPDLLQVWERGREARPLERALIVLGAGLPGVAWEELASLSIGQRNAGLLHLREITVGPDLDCVATCPACADQLELSFQTSDIKYDEFRGVDAAVYDLSVEGYDLRFRLLNSRDLALARRWRDPERGGRALVRRCVVAASRDGQPCPPEALPETALAALADALGERDPQADVRIGLSCPSCGHEFSLNFDVEEFFWTEVAARAIRVLREVHVLARAYGWREADILAMSTRRRQAYLELAPVV
ncbi:MAG TPA: phage baseplate protein [Chloroflexota bacterium]|nr:phage baseplate protein [Chloroflexota bacterium]